MTYGKSRNVVVVKNIDSSCVEQAILILKKDVAEKEYFGSEEDVVRQAQRIIDDFIKGKNIGKQKKHMKYFKYFICLCAITAALVLWRVFIR